MDPSDYGLGLAIATPLTATYTRDLTAADLLETEKPKGTKPVAIKKLRRRHHELAKMIATGLPQGQAAAAMGLTDSRVSILMEDPMFKNLLTMYADQVDAAFLTVNEKMANLGEDIIDDLHETFEADPDAFTIAQKHELLKTLMDRTGNGPATATTQVNVNVGLADRMEAARNRVAEHRQMRDITPVETPE